MNGYGIGSIGGANYANDVYFQQALNSPNANMMNYYNQQAAALAQAQAQSQASTASQLQTPVSAAGGSATAFKGANTSALDNINGTAQQEKSSNTGLWVGAALAATALVACTIKGNWNPIKGAKAFYGEFKNKLGEWTGKATEGVTKQFTAELGADGKKVSCLIPEKTKTITDAAEIAKCAAEDNINLERLKEFTSSSKLNGYSFNFGEGKDAVIGVVKDGKLAEVLREGKPIDGILTATEGENATLKTKLEEFITSFTGRDPKDAKKFYEGLQELRYTNVIGDETAEILRNIPNETASVTSLTTLGRFGTDSKEVLSYCNDHSGLKDALQKIVTDDGKVADGWKIFSFPQKVDNAICDIRNGKLVGITIDNKYFDTTTEDCKAFIESHKDKIQEIIKSAFTDGKVPTGTSVRFIQS